MTYSILFFVDAERTISLKSAKYVIDDLQKLLDFILLILLVFLIIRQHINLFSTATSKNIYFVLYQ